MRPPARSSNIESMLMHPSQHLEIARWRNKDLLAEAERRRLVELVGGRPAGGGLAMERNTGAQTREPAYRADGGEHVLKRAPRRLDPDRVVEHLPRLYRAARAWTDSREEAEDLVQETYAQVLARPRQLRGEDELGYLLRAMRNTLISQRRAESRRPATTELVEELAVGTRASDDPAEAAEIRLVYLAISELPEKFRDALVAVDVTGLSYPEAARALGMPEGTLTSRLFRARDRVARWLEEPPAGSTGIPLIPGEPFTLAPAA